MKTVVTRREAAAKFKLMALNTEDLQPFWLEIGNGTTFFYPEQASYGFHLRTSPEHHRAGLGSWRTIWNWK